MTVDRAARSLMACLLISSLQTQANATSAGASINATTAIEADRTFCMYSLEYQQRFEPCFPSKSACYALLQGMAADGPIAKSFMCYEEGTTESDRCNRKGLAIEQECALSKNFFTCVTVKSHTAKVRQAGTFIGRGFSWICE